MLDLLSIPFGIYQRLVDKEKVIMSIKLSIPFGIYQICVKELEELGYENFQSLLGFIAINHYGLKVLDELAFNPFWDLS